MPLLYDIPPAFLGAIESGQASLFGAVIKDTATGHILGHVQQTSVLSQVLSEAFGAGNQLAQGGFSPLNVISVVQNHQMQNALARLEDGMVLVQNLQYGTLALSGLGLGVSVAGFALMLRRLKGIERQLEAISEAVAEVTEDRREDDLSQILAEIGSDLRHVDTLTSRRDPRSVAEQLQLSLGRSAGRLEVHFQRIADVRGRTSMPIEQLERLWSLASAIRLCQDATLQAFFAADDLETAQAHAQVELERQIELLQTLSPDALSRLVARGERDPEAAGVLRQKALGQMRCLVDGIKGSVMGLASQIGIAQSLRAQEISGIEYLRSVREGTEKPLLYLTAA